MRAWSGPVGRLGYPTNEYQPRVIEQDGFYTRPLPLPLDWQEKTDEGHDNAITVGRVDTISVDPATGLINGTGVLFDEADIPEAGRATFLVEQGVVYPSVEAAACDVEWRETGGGYGTYEDGMWEDASPYNETCVFTSFELCKVTLVATQAVPEARITLGDTVSADSLTAAVRTSGWADMPVAKNDPAWDGAAAADRVMEWATDADGNVDWSRYAEAFLWQDPNADPETKGAYGLGIADVIDGELQIVPRGVYAVAGVLNGARGGADIPQDAQDTLRSTVTGIYKHIAGALDDSTIEAPFSVTADAGCPPPPASLFADPKLTGPTPPTIDGVHVFGHLATWDTEHVGIPGQKPPRSRTGYAYFHTGATLTDAGEVPTGKLTVGGGHADGTYGYLASADHYDNVGTAVATVTAGEDEFGIWFSGALLPDATPGQIETLRQSPLSGDWRNIGGNLELIAAHGVNAPGFPIPRARAVVASSGSGFSLVASAGVWSSVGDDGPSDGYVKRLASELIGQLKTAGLVAAAGEQPVEVASEAPAVLPEETARARAVAFARARARAAGVR